MTSRGWERHAHLLRPQPVAAQGVTAVGEVARLRGHLQRALLAELNDFLNGRTLTRSSAVLFPLRERHRPLPGALRDLVIRVHEATAVFEQSLVLMDASRSDRSRSAIECARLLSTLLREFHTPTVEWPPATRGVRVQVPDDFQSWRERAEDTQVIAAVGALREQLAPLGEHIEGLFLHGSLATLDHVARWSDLDDLIVVKEKTVNDAQRLLEFQRQVFQTVRTIYEFDPVQHHGHFFITTGDMRCFSEAVFPLKLFEYSVSLLGNRNLAFEIREDREDRLRSVISLARSIEAIPRSRMRRLYVFKAYLSSIMLLPSFYLQARGVYCYKRDSFAMAEPDFGAEWEAVEIASRLRREWSRLRFSRLFRRSLASVGNPGAIVIAYYLLRLTPREFLRELDSLWPAGQRFVERVITNLERDGVLESSGGAGDAP